MNTVGYVLDEHITAGKNIRCLSVYWIHGLGLKVISANKPAAVSLVLTKQTKRKIIHYA